MFTIYTKENISEREKRQYRRENGGLGDGHHFEKMSGFTKGWIGSEDRAEVGDHEVIFRTRGDDLSVVITVGRPDKEFSFVLKLGATSVLFIGVGDAEADLGEDRSPERHVRNDIEAVVAKSTDCALDALVKSRQAVLSHIIEHDRRGLTFRANWYAALSPDSTIRSVCEVGGAVDVRVGEGGL